MVFEDFASTEFPESRKDAYAHFPPRGDAYIYAICWIDGSREIPFYVGQTKRICERMDDYWTRQFAACTDFRVGEAVRYFKEVKQFRVTVRYKRSPIPRQEEYSIIRYMQTSGMRLLNDLLSYRWNDADQDQERNAIEKFCEVLIRSSGSSQL